jgi:hypothetical protein
VAAKSASVAARRLHFCAPMTRWIMFAVLLLTVAACVETDEPDGAELASQSAALTSPWCHDHPCPDFTVRVLKANYYTQTVTTTDGCSVTGTGILVGNFGTANAPATTVRVVRANGSTSTYNVPALARGFSYTIAATVPSGSVTTVDPSDGIAERDDEHNSFIYDCYFQNAP